MCAIEPKPLKCHRNFWALSCGLLLLLLLAPEANLAGLNQTTKPGPHFVDKALNAVRRFLNQPDAQAQFIGERLSFFRNEYVIISKTSPANFYVDDNAEVVHARMYHPCDMRQPNMLRLSQEEAVAAAKKFIDAIGIDIRDYRLTKIRASQPFASRKVFEVRWNQIIDNVEGPNWVSIFVEAETGAVVEFARWIEKNITVPTKPNITKQQAIDLAKKSVPFEITNANAKLDIWYDHRVNSKNRPQVLRWVVELDILQRTLNLKTQQYEMRSGKATVWINAVTGEVYDVRST